jgi:hypothetical protein
VTCVSVRGCVSAFRYVCACVFEKTNGNVRVCVRVRNLFWDCRRTSVCVWVWMFDRVTAMCVCGCVWCANNRSTCMCACVRVCVLETYSVCVCCVCACVFELYTHIHTRTQRTPPPPTHTPPIHHTLVRRQCHNRFRTHTHISIWFCLEGDEAWTCMQQNRTHMRADGIPTRSL